MLYIKKYASDKFRCPETKDNVLSVGQEAKFNIINILASACPIISKLTLTKSETSKKRRNTQWIPQ